MTRYRGKTEPFMTSAFTGGSEVGATASYNAVLGNLLLYVGDLQICIPVDDGAPLVARAECPVRKGSFGHIRHRNRDLRSHPDSGHRHLVWPHWLVYEVDALDREIVGAEFGVCRAHRPRVAVEDDLAHVEDDGAVGELERGDGVLLDDHRGDAVRLDARRRSSRSPGRSPAPGPHRARRAAGA